VNTDIKRTSCYTLKLHSLKLKN